MNDVLLLFLLLAAGLCIYAQQGNRETRLKSLTAGSTFIRRGMTKKDVIDILGAPDNRDSDVVWMWREHRGTRKISWQEMQLEHGYFLVFHNGKVLTPLLRNVESDPWEALSGFSGRSIYEAEMILGRRQRVA